MVGASYYFKGVEGERRFFMCFSSKHCVSTLRCSYGRSVLRPVFNRRSVWHFPFKIPRELPLLKIVYVHFDCASSQKTVVAGLAYGIFLLNFQAKLLCEMTMCIRRRLAQNGCCRISVWHFPPKFPHKMALVRWPVQPSRHFGPVTSLSL